MVKNPETFKVFEQVVNVEKNEKALNVIKRYEATNFKRNGTINLTRKQIGME